MKRITFILLGLLLFTFSVSAYDFIVDGVCYNINSDSTSVKVTYEGTGSQGMGYANLSGELIIPDNVTYDGKTYSVTSVGNNAFFGCTDLISVTIPNSVDSIGYNAFLNCSSLTSATIGNSVKMIRDWAFANCQSLMMITIPNSVIEIGEQTFSYCTGLTSVTIGDSLTKIGYMTFYKCTSLKSVTIGNSVKSIGNAAFFNCSNLTSVTLPNSVTSIEKTAFAKCTQLSELNIPSSVNHIGENAFNNTLWYDNQLPGVVYAGKVAYKYKGTMPEDTSIILEDGCTGVANQAFYECEGLTSLTMPNSVTVIGEWAFSKSGLTSVKISNMLTSIGYSAFSDCSNLTSVDIPNSVTEIGEWAFSNCTSLASVTLPNGLTKINSYTFRFCGGLTSLVIPDLVTSIGYSAFEGCSGLTSIVTKIKHPEYVTYMYDCFNGIPTSTCVVIVPKGTLELYQTTSPWSDFINIVENAESFVEGDVNGDGNVTAADVTALYDFLLNNDTDNLIIGDINGDGNITAADITAVYDILLGGTSTDPHPLITTEYTVNGVSFKMVKVDGGTFMMGAKYNDTEALSSEKPAHQVTLTNSYYIGQTEVTQELWEAVMGNNPSFFNGDNYGTNLQRPVENISWDECQLFIAKLNEMTGNDFRLPTEAEWEFAARGGNNSRGYIFSGSDNIDDVGWYNMNTSHVFQGEGYGTQPVATKSPNELGIYDMSGNVMEWCQDYYHYDYYSISPSINPTGPASGDIHVCRNGCWYQDAWFCRVTYRHWLGPQDHTSYLGLRLAL